MPGEENEKPRFKAVTEEISPEATPVHSHTEHAHHEHHEHPHESHEHKHTEHHHEPPMSEPVPATSLPIDTTPVPETNNITPLIPVVEKKSTFGQVLGFLGIMIGVAFLIAFAMGGVYTYISGTNSQTATPSPTPAEEIIPIEPTPVVSPTPSASPIPLNKYTVSVLNGSGKIGEAGKVKTILEKAGFKVSYTGNAESFDLDETTIQVKDTVTADAVKKLEDSLKSTYEVTVGEALDAKSKYDIIITVGSQ